MDSNRPGNYSLADQLLSIPLFQGLSQNDFHEIMGHTRFHFRKSEAGRLVVKSDSYCTDLIVLLKGTLEVTTVSADHHYEVTELLHAQASIEPHRLFGIYQHYTSQYRTQTECQFVYISKQEIVRLFNTYEIVRINYLNILSTAVHRFTKQQWSPTPTDLGERILHFFHSHSLFPAGEKKFRIKMTDLAHELNDSRLDISRALNKLQEEGRLSLSRGAVTVHDR